MKLAALAFVAASMVGGTASAVTVTLLGDSEQGASNTAGLTFAQGYGAYVPIGAAVGGNLVSVVDNNPGQYQSPFNSNVLTGTQSFFSSPALAGPGTITYSAPQTSFTFLWGSIDSYNTLSFDNTYSITGTDLINLFALGGSPANFEQVAQVTFDFTSGPGVTGGFTTVSFLSVGQNAFEFALPPVPVPAAGLLLVGGLGALGALRRKKA